MTTTAPPPLALDLQCTRCQTVSPFTVPWALYDPRDEADVSDGWDRVVLGRIFTCPSCGAVDEYALTERSLAAIVTESASTAPTRRVSRGAAYLWDGTAQHRPARSLAHLRALAERAPEDPEGWRRLGNFCDRFGLDDEAESAWFKAASLGQPDFEASFNLARKLANRGAVEAVTHLLEAIERFPRAEIPSAEKRAAFADELAELIFALADRTDAKTLPLWLVAAWTSVAVDGAVAPSMGAVDVRAIQRREGLAEFMARDAVIGLFLRNERDREWDTTKLLGLIEHGETAQAPARTPAAPPKPGRNDACPCGSGKKYKKCHGR